MASFETDLLHFSDNGAWSLGAINTPVYRASLFGYETYQDFIDARAQGKFVYSRVGNPTRANLEAKIAHLEGADHAIALSSGMAAISAALLALLKGGDHLLVARCCYGPTRSLCDTLLAAMGVEVEYFDSDEASDLTLYLKPNTRAIYLESPGTFTLQIQDLRAVARLARANNIYTLIDNTWATPLYQQPISLGVDVVLHTATKYIGGHSDVMAGLIVCNAALYQRIQPIAEVLGGALSPDDAYLVTRGLRTLAIRLERQGDSALKLARWLQSRPEVKRVYHPGLPDFPDYELGRSQMSGYTGLFTVSMEPAAPEKAQHAFVDAMSYFTIGVSWGGYESLILPISDSYRQVPEVRRSMGIEDEMYRISVGLENIEDLIRDLEAGFAARAAAINNS
ncbi:MAG TPA: cystathionine beta-lyase [Chloroflexia bacterium]|nr:cystathionine beta-lyase [Chloroflexia bacterium]